MSEATGTAEREVEEREVDEAEVAERKVEGLSAVRTFLTSVVSVRDIHRNLRCITFGGGDLATFEPNGPDAFVYALVPPPGRTSLSIDRTFTWEQYELLPEADRPVGAYFTIRHWRPDGAEVDILVAMHGDIGAASAWAGRTQPGDPVALWGPRTMFHPPGDTDALVLVADETALPAVAVILEQLPADVAVRVVAEVAGEDERHDLPARPSVEVRWLHRDGAPAGATSLLVDAVRHLDLPGRRPYVWGGGESRAMTAVRRHVRDVVGIDRDAVDLIAYWRLTRTRG